VESVETRPGNSIGAKDAIYARVTRHLLPILFVSYVIAYIDRVNVGFAKLQMLHDLGFSEATYGMGAGIFFAGYCLNQVPANLMLARLGARRWMASIMVVWGIVSASMMFVRTPESFYILRFLLGVAEAGMFPGLVFYMTRWYPSHRRGRIMALLMTAQPLAGVIGGPLSGWIMQSFHDVKQIAGWQWLFLIEALPAVVMGLLLLRLIDDKIDDARWLSADEKAVLNDAIKADEARKSAQLSILEVLRSGRVWLLGLLDFSSVIGLYGVAFWLPSIIRATGVRAPLQIGLLTLIPYGVATVAMVLVSRNSDLTGERRWHLAISNLVGGVGLMLSTLDAGNTALSLLGLTIATAGIISSQPLFWNLPTAILGGTSAAAAIGLINTIGNSAGFLSPLAVGWITDVTHSTRIGMFMLAAWMFMGTALALCIPARLVNRKREIESKSTV